MRLTHQLKKPQTLGLGNSCNPEGALHMLFSQPQNVVERRCTTSKKQIGPRHVTSSLTPKTLACQLAIYLAKKKRTVIFCPGVGWSRGLREGNIGASGQFGGQEATRLVSAMSSGSLMPFPPPTPIYR
jgi:hypothetical protein